MVQATCKERIGRELESTLDTLRKLWELHCEDSEAYDDELGNLYEYGLCFDYVAPDTFEDQDEGYWRYQLSTGGPGDEFRFYSSGPQWEPYRIEYWFLDWFDGASRTLYDEARDLLLEIWHWFDDMGTVEHQYNQAID